MAGIADHIEAKSDQMNADDLIGGPRVIVIERVLVKGKGSEQPVTIHYRGDNGKPYKPNKGMMRVLVAIWGNNEDGEYVGRSLQVYRDPTVTWGNEPIGGIKIGAASHIDKPAELYLQVKKGKKAKHTVEVLRQGQEQQRAEPTADAAREAIAGAADLAALGRVWGSPRMAPFKAELQEAYDERLQALTPRLNAPSEGSDFDAA